jgi:ATP/maltotriose-dependent transcriptional regulator MalT
VRRLLLRTSVLDRVSGELADLLTGGTGSERMLYDLEQAGAFVVSLDARRTWFRYHQMFADLLQLELRRTAPDEVPPLHAAADWFAGHGYPAEAVRHAQAAQDWDLAARVLTDHWLGLYLDGQAAAARELLTQFPPRWRSRMRSSPRWRQLGNSPGIVGGGGAAARACHPAAGIGARRPARALPGHAHHRAAVPRPAAR